MRIYGYTLLVYLLFSVAAFGQQESGPECPPDRVCITVDEARKALIDADTVEAQVKEIEAKDATIEQLRGEIGRLRIELAKTVGDKTGAEQMIVRLSAMVDLLLKSTKKKCLPFSVCIN